MPDRLDEIRERLEACSEVDFFVDEVRYLLKEVDVKAQANAVLLDRAEVLSNLLEDAERVKAEIDDLRLAQKARADKAEAQLATLREAAMWVATPEVMTWADAPDTPKKLWQAIVYLSDVLYEQAAALKEIRDA